MVKFSPEGKVLMTLGKSGVSGNPPEAFTDPNDVVTAPNGDIHVAESHTNLETTPNAVARISVFDKNGKFIKSFGKLGSGPGEFRTPHGMVFDSKGRLIVADRGNHRLQILDRNDGKFVGELKNFSRTSGLVIDKDDTLYTIAGNATNVTPLTSLATMDPLTAHHGSLRPPRKKSRIVWPRSVRRSASHDVPAM